MSYICVECFNIFEEPLRWEESHGLDFPPFEKHTGCPDCGGAYVEAHKCECCGEYITGQYIKLNNQERICEACYVQMEIGDEE
jgi:hypothetical protein